MTVATCTDCNTPHPDLDFDIYSGFETTPKIAFSMSEDIEVGICESCFFTNTYEIVLEDILKDAVLGSIEQDLGEGSYRITKLLRDYADKIDAEADKHKHEWGD